MGISVDFYLMLFVFIVFMITMYILNIWLYKPLLAYMDGRNKQIEQSRKAIEDSKQGHEDAHLEIDKVLDEARAIIAKNLAAANEEGKKEYDKIVELAQQEIAGLREEFENELKRDKIELQNELNSHLSEYANDFKVMMERA